VTTDILFLQKRSPDAALGEGWTELRSIDTAGVSVQQDYGRFPSPLLFHPLLPSVRCSFFDQGCNLLRP